MKNEKHTETINTRWTPAERRALEADAKRNGLKVSAFIRFLYYRWRDPNATMPAPAWVKKK